LKLLSAVPRERGLRHAINAPTRYTTLLSAVPRERGLRRICSLNPDETAF
jgi:hypothetical protein